MDKNLIKGGSLENAIVVRGDAVLSKEPQRFPDEFVRHKILDEGVIDIPPPPDPPFDIETFDPIEPPWQAIREWIPDDDAEPGFDLFDQRTESGRPVGIPREDGYILVLDSD
jgi:hypothetical protein